MFGLSGLLGSGAAAGLLGNIAGSLFDNKEQSGESNRTENNFQDAYSRNFGEGQAGPGAFTAPSFTDQFIPSLQQAFSSIGLSPFSGQLTAPVDPLQVQANQAGTQLAFDNLGQGTGVRDLANELISGSTIDPNRSPGFANMLQAATRPAIQAFGEQVIPQITSSAIANGAFGGSRNGVALGLAADRLGETLADTGGQLAYANAQSERDRQLQFGPALLNAAFGLDAAPINLATQLGEQRRGFAQDAVSENFQLDQLARQQPFQTLGQFGELLRLVGDQRTVSDSEAARQSVGEGTSAGTFSQEFDPGTLGRLQELVNAGALGQQGLNDPAGRDPFAFLFGG